MIDNKTTIHKSLIDVDVNIQTFTQTSTMRRIHTVKSAIKAHDLKQMKQLNSKN